MRTDHVVPRRDRSILVHLLAIWFVLIAGPATAGACTSDAECDDGDTCSLIDVCLAGVCVSGGGGDTDGDGRCEAEDVCPGIADPLQLDLDEDGLGDLCDGDDAVIELIVAKLKPNRKTPPQQPDGMFLGKGEFITAPPEDTFQIAQGLLVRIQDALMVDETFSWDAGECTTGTNGVIKCFSVDRLRKIVLKPLRTFPRLFRFVFRIKKLDIHGPFFGPVVISLVNSPAQLTEGTDRVGEIIDCFATNAGLKCKE
jgi:hypothetical protein